MIKRNCGFTIAELIVIMGMAAVLFLFASVSLLTVSRSSSFDTTLATLVNDIKGQQTRAMTGDTAGSGPADSYGIYFEPGRYILFRGTAYNSGDPNNFSVNLDDNINLGTVSFPSSSLVFSQGTGEVSGYAAGFDSVSLLDERNGETKVITINAYGALTIE